MQEHAIRTLHVAPAQRHIPTGRLGQPRFGYILKPPFRKASKFDTVQDLDWIRSEPSPNWSVLPESERVGASALGKNWPTEGMEANEALSELLPPLMPCPK